jgi:heat shock protein HspQ
MNKPKYKLGDMIQDNVTGVIEIIISIDPTYHIYRYKTQYDDPRQKSFTKARFQRWFEDIIDKYYTVIGNLFDKENRHD